MYFCGIDISKGKSNACVIDKNRKIVKQFAFDHNKQGFDLLLANLPEDCKVGLEPTGNYCKVVFDFLKDKVDVMYVDGVQMSSFAELFSPTRKNDKNDAKLIACYLSYDFKGVEIVRMSELKDLCRMHHNLVKQLARYKCMFKDQASIIFPELEKIFQLKDSRGIPYLLLKYPSPKSIVEASDEDVRKAITENLKLTAKFTPEYVKKLKELAKNSVGVKDYPTAYFQSIIKLMLYHQEQVNTLRKQMEEKLKQTPYYKVTDQFGYSSNVLACIVAEIVDIRRFPTHKHFVSYCGFDITENTSGTSVNKQSRITKRGNRILRSCFYMMTLAHIRSKTKNYEFYQRLKEKGKHSKKAMIAMARKLAIQCYYEMKKCHTD